MAQQPHIPALRFSGAYWALFGVFAALPSITMLERFFSVVAANTSLPG